MRHLLLCDNTAAAGTSGEYFCLERQCVALQPGWHSTPQHPTKYIQVAGSQVSLSPVTSVHSHIDVQAHQPWLPRCTACICDCVILLWLVPLPMLLQLPQGALPLAGGSGTISRAIRLQPFTSWQVQQEFYFPQPGVFKQAPVSVVSASGR